MVYCDQSAGNAENYFNFPAKFCLTMLCLQAINILTSSKELLDLIKNVDSVFHSEHAGCRKLMFSSLCRFVPSIREQLQVTFCIYHLF